MRTKFFLFFSFLFLCSLVYSVSATSPVVVGNMINLSLGNNGVVHQSMNNFWNNYTTIDVIYFKPCPTIIFCSSSEVYVSLNGSQQCFTEDFTVCLTPSASDIDLSYISLGKDVLIKVQVSAWSGSMFTGYDSQTIYVSTSSTISGTFCTGGDFITQYACHLADAFPSYETISVSQRFSMVFIVMAIVTFMMYLLFYLFAHTINSFMNWIVFLIDIVLFFYFASIRYIPVVLVVILGIVIILIAYFRVRGGH